MSSPAHVRHFTWRGATIVAESTGSGERTFVLIHGIGMGRSVFADLTQHLRHHGRVVAIDLPGYGEAPEPPRTLTVERNADVVAAYLSDHTSGDVTIVGHSMGAQVAVEVEARHPSSARRLVLAAPHLRLKLRAMLVHRPEETFLRVHVPVLVLRGQDDVVAPRAWCEEVVRLLPEGALAEIPEHGHETMIRDSAPAAALIVEFAERT